MNIPYVMKKCTKCGRWLVASKANFRRHKRGKYGLYCHCKECVSEEKKRYYEANKDKSKQYREANKDKIAEQKKQYYEANKDKIAEYYKQWHEKYGEQYYKTNKDKKAEQRKQYYQSPQGQVAIFNGRQRRRTKEEQQGTGITKNQWLEMMSFFDWKCAYSSERLTKDTRSVDHIVPLNSRGDNMIWNMVPMTRSLNSSKQDKDMLEWYRKQDFYDTKRLDKIYEWQEYAFNKWYKEEK